MTRQPLESQKQDKQPATLHALDAQAVDHLLGGESATGVDPARLASVRALGSLMDQWKAEDPPLDLKNRTLAKVRKAREESRRRTEPMKFSFAPGRLTEVAAVAAIVLIAFSLAVPMLVRARDHERQVYCQSNLRQVGEAFGAYAADFGDMLPRTRTVPYDEWWRVGQTTAYGQPVKSNSANLYLLTRQGYVRTSTLACPDNSDTPRKMVAHAQDWPDAQAVSYSYQNQYTPRPYLVSSVGDMVVLADKNPLFRIRSGAKEKFEHRRDLEPTTSSRFHRSRGQNVLDATGSAGWTADAVMPRYQDNIWLASQVTEYRGNEVPASQDDTFLVP